MGEKEKSIIGSNLKYLRKIRNMTQEALAEELGIGRHSVGSYEEGRAEPKIETLVAISRLFEVPMEALVTEDFGALSVGEIEAIKGEFKPDLLGERLRTLTVPVDRDGNERISLVAQKAAAGYLNGYGDQEFIGNLPTFDLPLTSLRNGSFRAFEVKGDSMLPIKSGSFVVGEYVQNWKDIKDGNIYIVITKNDGVVLKRVYSKIGKNLEDGALQLKSDNPTYPSFDVKLEDVTEVWKAKAYISEEFPEPDMSLEKISSIVLELQQEVIRMKRS